MPLTVKRAVSAKKIAASEPAAHQRRPSRSAQPASSSRSAPAAASLLPANYAELLGELKVQQLVGQIPWGHHLVLLTKVKEPSARAWYLEQTVVRGWSRAVLTRPAVPA